MWTWSRWVAAFIRPGVTGTWSQRVLECRRPVEGILSFVPWYVSPSGARYRVFMYHLCDLYPTGTLVLDPSGHSAPAPVAADAIHTLWLGAYALARVGSEEPACPARVSGLADGVMAFLTRLQSCLRGAGRAASLCAAAGDLLSLVRHLEESEQLCARKWHAAWQAARALGERIVRAGEAAEVRDEDPQQVLEPYFEALEIRRGYHDGSLRSRYLPAVRRLRAEIGRMPECASTGVAEQRRFLAQLEALVAGDSTLGLYPSARAHELAYPQQVLRRLVRGTRRPRSEERR